MGYGFDRQMNWEWGCKGEIERNVVEMERVHEFEFQGVGSAQFVAN